MHKESFENIKSHILNKLRKLDKKLTYHSVEHTLDVTKEAERIGLSENVAREDDMFLLKVAALYHDTGFLFAYDGHEAYSCKVFKQEAPEFGFSTEETNIVCGIIGATKIPQTPLTKLEEIICDADLDYLGREDFLPVSNKLKEEFLAYGIAKNETEWEELQVNFLTGHRFFTTTSIKEKNDIKQQHLAKILESLTI